MIAIDVIFFDVDGTLVDSRVDIANAVNYTLRKLGAAERPDEEIISYVGTGMKDLVRKSLGDENAHLEDKCLDILSRYYVKHSTDRSTLYPHVKETLEYFKGKRKYVVTNRYEAFADVTLKGLGIRKYFELIIGGDDENCLKPSACVLDNALTDLKIDKKKTLIVGDMAIDINTGKNSGIKTCWVTYGLGKRKDVAPLEPDFIIDDMLELKKIVL